MQAYLRWEGSMHVLLMPMILVASAHCVLAQAGPVDRWGSFSEGSWIKAKNIYEGGTRKAEQEVKQILVESKPEECVISHELSGGGKATIRFRRDLLGSIAGPECTLVDQKDLGDEELRVASKTCLCHVREIRFKLSKDATIVDVLKLWECDQVPGRVAKVEGTLHDTGMPKGGGWKYAGQVTSLDDLLTIGGKDFHCALLEVTATGPGTWTNKVWLNAAIPSLIARSIGIRVSGGMKESSEWKVVEFEAKK